MMIPDRIFKDDKPRPGTVVCNRRRDRAYYYEDDGSLRLIPNPIIHPDGKVVVSSLAVQARISYLQTKFGSG